MRKSAFRQLEKEDSIYWPAKYLVLLKSQTPPKLLKDKLLLNFPRRLEHSWFLDSTVNEKTNSPLVDQLNLSDPQCVCQISTFSWSEKDHPQSYGLSNKHENSPTKTPPTKQQTIRSCGSSQQYEISVVARESIMVMTGCVYMRKCSENLEMNIQLPWLSIFEPYFNMKIDAGRISEGPGCNWPWGGFNTGIMVDCSKRGLKNLWFPSRLTA